MNWEQEQKLKSMAEQISHEKMQACGTIDPSAKCAAPGLHERLRSQLHHAQHQARQREQLEELTYLLDKNPEVARILELFEAVGR